MRQLRFYFTVLHSPKPIHKLKCSGFNYQLIFYLHQSLSRNCDWSGVDQEWYFKLPCWDLLGHLEMFKGMWFHFSSLPKPCNCNEGIFSEVLQLHKAAITNILKINSINFWKSLWKEILVSSKKLFEQYGSKLRLFLREMQSPCETISNP